MFYSPLSGWIFLDWEWRDVGLGDHRNLSLEVLGERYWTSMIGMTAYLKASMVCFHSLIVSITPDFFNAQYLRDLIVLSHRGKI